MSVAASLGKEMKTTVHPHQEGKFAAGCCIPNPTLWVHPSPGSFAGVGHGLPPAANASRHSGSKRAPSKDRSNIMQKFVHDCLYKW